MALSGLMKSNVKYTVVQGLGFFLLTVFGICHQSNTEGVDGAQQLWAARGRAQSQFSFYVTRRQHLIPLISPPSSSSTSSSSFPSTPFPSFIRVCTPAWLSSCLPACSFSPPFLVPPLPPKRSKIFSFLYPRSLSPSVSTSSIRISVPHLHDATGVLSPAPISPLSSRLRDPTMCLASPLECLTGISNVICPKQSSCISLPNILSPSSHFKEWKSHFPSCSGQLLL